MKPYEFIFGTNSRLTFLAFREMSWWRLDGLAWNRLLASMVPSRWILIMSSHTPSDLVTSAGQKFTLSNMFDSWPNTCKTTEITISLSCSLLCHLITKCQHANAKIANMVNNMVASHQHWEHFSILITLCTLHPCTIVFLFKIYRTFDLCMAYVALHCCFLYICICIYFF